MNILFLTGKLTSIGDTTITITTDNISHIRVKMSETLFKGVSQYLRLDKPIAVKGNLHIENDNIFVEAEKITVLGKEETEYDK